MPTASFRLRCAGRTSGHSQAGASGDRRCSVRRAAILAAAAMTWQSGWPRPESPFRRIRFPPRTRLMTHPKPSRSLPRSLPTDPPAALSWPPGRRVMARRPWYHGPMAGGQRPGSLGVVTVGPLRRGRAARVSRPSVRSVVSLRPQGTGPTAWGSWPSGCAQRPGGLGIMAVEPRCPGRRWLRPGRPAAIPPCLVGNVAVRGR